MCTTRDVIKQWNGKGFEGLAGKNGELEGRNNFGSS